MSKPITAEQKAISTFLAAGATPCNSFAPHAQEYYTDKLGETSKCLPDFYIYHEGKHKFFEYKAHSLNHKGSKKASLTKLRTQYQYRFRRPPGGLSHDAISTALWRAEHRTDCLQNAWNHSIHKHLIIQKTLAHECYVVVFEKQPLPADAKYYNSKGLGWITLNQLPNYLSSSST